VAPPVLSNLTETTFRAALALGGTVTFATNGTITLSGSTIEISRDTILDGTGQDVTITGPLRLFQVDGNVHFTLTNVTLAGGSADSGAAVYNDGFLTLERCRFAGNGTHGPNASSPGAAGGNAGGGAMYNAGTLMAHRCLFSANSATGGGGGPGEALPPTAAAGTGGAGSGGALYNAGVATISECTFETNSTTGGGGGAGVVGELEYHGVNFWSTAGGDGGDGSGGAIFNSGDLTLLDCTFTGNAASGGGGSGGAASPPAAEGSGYAGTGAPGGGGGSGYGGALRNAGTVTILGSTLAGNTCLGGGGGPGGMGMMGGRGGPGGSGSGGAVFDDSATASLLNSTITGNTSLGGWGGMGGGGTMGDPGGNGGGGGSASGGGVCGPCSLTNCTLVSNSAVGSAGGPPGSGSNGPGGTAYPGQNGASAGGGSSGATLVNSLIVASSPADSTPSGTLDALHNLWISTNSGVVGPLADNGGPTLTMALLPGSPAIDAADTAVAPPTDQRGFPRPFGAAADIGAFEYGSWPLLSISRSQAGGFAIHAQAASGQPCRLLTSTTLTNWVAVATNAIGPDGSLIFQIGAGGDQQRFWQVVSP